MRAFALHVGSFALYNALIGYLLVNREETDARGLLLYTIALGLHFVVNDRALDEHHGALYPPGRALAARGVRHRRLAGGRGGGGRAGRGRGPTSSPSSPAAS